MLDAGVGDWSENIWRFLWNLTRIRFAFVCWLSRMAFILLSLTTCKTYSCIYSLHNAPFSTELVIWPVCMSCRLTSKFKKVFPLLFCHSTPDEYIWKTTSKSQSCDQTLILILSDLWKPVKLWTKSNWHHNKLTWIIDFYIKVSFLKQCHCELWWKRYRVHLLHSSSTTMKAKTVIICNVVWRKLKREQISKTAGELERYCAISSDKIGINKSVSGCLIMIPKCI